MRIELLFGCIGGRVLPRLSNTIFCITFVAVVINCTGCATQGSTSFQSHDSRIVGTWYSTESSPFEVMSYGEKTYFPNGAACGFFIDVYPDGTRTMVVFESRWEIKDNHLLSTVLKSNSSDLPVDGKPIVDSIISVDSHVMILHADYPPYDIYSRHKLAANRHDSLCKLFEVVTHGGKQGRT